MKKIICILICTLMIITIIPSVSSISKLSIPEKKINQNNLINNKYEKNQILSEFVSMQNPPKISEMNFKSIKPLPKNTPDEFSWTEYNGKDWTTPAKHQGNCGSCWAFAAMSVYESIIKIKENCAEFNPDLSEQYILSCIKGAGSCYGGNTHRAFELLNSTSANGNYHDGIIPEECMLYQADDDIPCSDKCDNWESLLVPIYDFGTWQVKGSDDDREAIKTHIMETGPVAAYIKGTDMFKIWGALNHNPEDFFDNILPVVGINHVIMIVGWKDISSAPNGGYWICKNSWGQGWGYNGFFNIAYGSLNIDKYLITWAGYDPDSFNWSPIPITDGPYGVYLGNELSLDGSDSIGIEGEILSYFWEFGDGFNDTGITTTHNYADLGKYTVTLTATDSEGYIGDSETNLWVQDSNLPPNKPSISGPVSGMVNANKKYTVSSTDPEGNDIWFLIKWSEEETYQIYGPYKSGEEVTIGHYWQKIGSHTISVKAKDVFNDESELETFNIRIPKNKARDISGLLLYKVINRFPFISILVKIISNIDLVF